MPLTRGGRKSVAGPTGRWSQAADQKLMPIPMDAPVMLSSAKK